MLSDYCKADQIPDEFEKLPPFIQLCLQKNKNQLVWYWKLEIFVRTYEMKIDNILFSIKIYNDNHWQICWSIFVYNMLKNIYINRNKQYMYVYIVLEINRKTQPESTPDWLNGNFIRIWVYEYFRSVQMSKSGKFEKNGRLALIILIYTYAE